MIDHCTWVNALCPDDLCVLEYGHPGTKQNRHITGTTAGSANTSRAEQEELLKDDAATGWIEGAGYLAPRGTSVEDLITLGWRQAR
jgi:hypothetical protein